MRAGVIAVAMAVALGGAASALAGGQMRGMGRLNGTVVDQSGVPVPVVEVKAIMGSGEEIAGRCDEDGNWIVGGIGRGEWSLEFAKAGFATAHVRALVKKEEMRSDPISVTLRKQD